MFLVGVLSWWYGAGWRQRALLMRAQIAKVADFFSIGLLLQTLFNPFRQISAGRVKGPIGVVMRAFFDRLISRLIGAFVRLMLIVAGISIIIVYSLWSVLLLVAWALVPLLPVAGVALWSSGLVVSWK